MKVTMTGATGLIGSRVVAKLLSLGHEVTVLSRHPDAARAKLGDVQASVWHSAVEDPPIAALEGADAILNFAGEPVSQRWTPDAKESIRASRVDATRRLVSTLATIPAELRPTVLVNGSASGYYGEGGDEILIETSPQGESFTAEVSAAWEAEANKASELGMRVALVRTGLVLAKEGGALPVIAKPMRFGAGTWMGSGHQYVPWIHAEDEAGLIVAALLHDSFSGPVNAGAPEQVTNKEISKAIGKQLKRPVFASAPAAVLKAALGEQSILILESCRMASERASELNYEFVYPDLASALTEAL